MTREEMSDVVVTVDTHTTVVKRRMEPVFVSLLSLLKVDGNEKLCGSKRRQ